MSPEKYYTQPESPLHETIIDRDGIGYYLVFCNRLGCGFEETDIITYADAEIIGELHEKQDSQS